MLDRLRQLLVLVSLFSKMSKRSGHRPARVFDDIQIAELLNNSKFEDSDYEDVFIPEPDQETSSDSSSSSESEGGEMKITKSRGGPTRRAQSGRVRVGRGRGRSTSTRVRRAQSASASSARSSPSFEHPNRITQDAEWYENNEMNFINSPLMQPSYLPMSIDESNYYNKFSYIDNYISDKFFMLITDKSNQTFVKKNGKSLNLTLKETKVFFGITILMSCINYPVQRMYWEKNWRIAIIADSMSRDRYFLIRNSLKLVYDDDIPQEEREKDKLWKVRPILDSVLAGCQKQVPEQQISLDEMMIPFFGTCGMKQYCPNKPNPVGLKAFILANPNGLVCNMVIYQGKTTFPSYTNAGFGLGESAVLKLSEILVPGSIIYFDRYFTTIKLAKELHNRGLKCAGTLMKNRIPADARNELESDSSMKKRGRGSYQVLTNTDNTIAITKWMDNKPVVMLSTAHAACETDLCSRWCKKDKLYKQVVRPEVIKQYNSKMGGVDMADRLISVCPERSRTKKWPVRFISHMIDLAVSNSWLLYKEAELKKGIPLKRIQQLRSYKMQLGEQILEQNQLAELNEVENDCKERSIKRPVGRPGIVPVPSIMRRLHGNIHLPEHLDKQQRCRLSGCDKRSLFKCSDCNVALCLNPTRNCFRAFHRIGTR